MAKAHQVVGTREGLTHEPARSLEHLQIFPGIDVKVLKEQKASRAGSTYICVHTAELMAGVTHVSCVCLFLQLLLECSGNQFATELQPLSL